jgi:DNA repair exonuclease SbcCD ATPase subunit
MSYDLGTVILPIQSKGGAETIAEVTKLADTLDKKLSPAVQEVIDRLQYYSRVQKQLSSSSQTMGSFISPRELDLAAQRVQGLESALANTRRGMNGFGVATQQVGYQVGDFFVQVQSGTNWLVAFGQQATQLVGILPMMGAGFLGLSTGGLIALSAGLGIAIPLVTAIGAAFLRTRDEANIFDDAMTQVKETMDGFDESSNIVSMSLEELIKKYGEAAQRVRQFALVQAELRLSQAESALSDQIPILNDTIDLYTQVGMAGRQSIQDIQEAFKLARPEAVMLYHTMMSIKEAKTFEAQQKALTDFLDTLDELGIPLNQIPEDLSLALDQMLKLSNATDEARARMEELRGATRGMTIGVPLYEQGLPNLLPPEVSTGTEDTGTSSGVGGGGGGISIQDRLQSDLDSLRQYLMDAKESEMISYQERQETLRQALEEKLLTIQEYNTLEKELTEKHNAVIAEIDAKRRYKTLQEAGTFFGAMANLAQAGGQKYIKVARVLGATEALINTFIAQSQVLRDPNLGFFGKMAAYAAIGATGLGLVASLRSGSDSASSAGGGGKGGGMPKGSASVPASSGTTSPAQTVYISGLDPNALFTGEQLANLFDSFYKENDNRGKVFVVAR